MTLRAGEVGQFVLGRFFSQRRVNGGFSSPFSPNSFILTHLQDCFWCFLVQ